MDEVLEEHQEALEDRGEGRSRFIQQPGGYGGEDLRDPEYDVRAVAAEQDTRRAAAERDPRDAPESMAGAGAPATLPCGVAAVIVEPWKRSPVDADVSRFFSATVTTMSACGPFEPSACRAASTKRSQPSKMSSERSAPAAERHASPIWPRVLARSSTPSSCRTTDSRVCLRPFTASGAPEEILVSV